MERGYGGSARLGGASQTPTARSQGFPKMLVDKYRCARPAGPLCGSLVPADSGGGGTCRLPPAACGGLPAGRSGNVC